jgi:hypothetical protein
VRQGLIDAVKDIVEQEEQTAIKVYPLFNSTREGYAVILEEVEEAKFEVDMVAETLERLWYSIKHNESDSTSEMVKMLNLYAERAACECIQIAAMANKFVQSMNQRK